MESGDDFDTDNPFEEGLNPPDPSPADSEEADEGEGEDEDNDDGNKGEEHEEEEREDEMDEGDDEATVTFEGVMNPLDFVEGNTSEVQLYQQFERIEYEHEALAERKRKRIELANQGQELVQRPRKNIGATLEEVAEVMNLGDRKRRKKAKKRGRRKGSRINLSPEITKKLGDANLHYAHGRYEDAISLMKEVVWLAPNLPDPYHTLGLVYNSKGDKKKATKFYMIAAFLSPKNTSLWKRLVTCSM